MRGTRMRSKNYFNNMNNFSVFVEKGQIISEFSCSRIVVLIGGVKL